MSDDLRDAIAAVILNNSPVNTHPWDAEAMADAVLTMPEIERLKAIVDAIPDKDDPVGWVQRVAAMMDQPHVLKLGADGWTIEHPLTCRLDGTPLHECETHVTIAPHVDRLLDEWSIGTYRVWLDDGIWCGFDGSPDERAQIMQGELT